jgi:hypothetical protein
VDEINAVGVMQLRSSNWSFATIKGGDVIFPTCRRVGAQRKVTATIWIFATLAFALSP